MIFWTDYPSLTHILTIVNNTQNRFKPHWLSNSASLVPSKPKRISPCTHRVFPLLEIHSITSLLESQCILKRTKSLLHNGCKWEHSPRYTEMSLWLFRHRIFVPVLNVSDVPPCGIVGFSEVEILVRFNMLWPSKGWATRANRFKLRRG